MCRGCVFVYWRLKYSLICFEIGRKRIARSWFNHVYCGLALGYAKYHQSRESYVRCVLCELDVKVASRGITTFMEHCRGVQHHRLDCLVRLRRGLALRDRDGNLMSTSDSATQAALLKGVTVPVMERCPDVTPAEVFQLELEGRPVWDDLERDETDSQERTVRLFLCLVIDALYRDCDLMSVCGLWEIMVATDAQHVTMFGRRCRLDDVLVTIFLYFVTRDGGRVK